MHYTELGATGVRVSVAGLGCGGFSRLGLARGGGEADAIAVVHEALDLGVNLLDTAAAYGTEAVVGRAFLRGFSLRARCSSAAQIRRSAASRLRVWERLSVPIRTSPVGRWRTRTLDSVLFFFWPPGPEDRYGVISQSRASFSRYLGRGTGRIYVDRTRRGRPRKRRPGGPGARIVTAVA